MVKRKSGLIKHLRALHRDLEHLWRDNQHTKSDVVDAMESTNPVADGRRAPKDRTKGRKPNASAKKKTESDGVKRNSSKNAKKRGDGSCTDGDSHYMNGARSVTGAAQTPPLSPHARNDRTARAASEQLPHTTSANPRTMAGTSDEVNVNNIIDNCFFVDDTLNCNVVLHSPFSSDTDVDGFIMSNSNEGNTMNKELLNKFHDRLEEMEEKIDNNDFKVFWNEMLDDENDVNDEHAHDELEDASTDANTIEFDDMQTAKQQINEYA